MSLDRSSRRGSGAGFVVLEIAHGGDGFDKQDAKRINAETFIFNPSEIHGGGGTGGGTGSGLGLSLAKTIVEAHGGRLWVKSAGVGRGSVFAMGIPLGSGACEVIDFFPQVETRKEQLMASWSARSNRTNLPPLPTFKDNVHQVPNSTIVPVIVSTGTVEISSVRNPRLDDINLSPSPQVMSSPLMSIPTSPREETTTASGLIGVCSVGELSALTAGKGTDSSLSGLHALVVEDSKVARTMLVKLLKSLKCTTEEAEDGAVAVKMVSAVINYEADHSNDNIFDNNETDVHDGKPPMYDFILCDSVMPVMDGPTAAQKIRAMGYDKPIIGVTGNTLPEQIQDFIAHGADEVVTKPVKLAVLKETIGRRCSNSNAAQTVKVLTETTAKKVTLIPGSNVEVVDTVLSPLSFPISSREAHVITSKESSPTAEKVAFFPFAGLHALVVEDSKVARTMLVKLLKSLKCTTDEAEDGAVAVKMVSAVINHEADHRNENTEMHNIFDKTDALHALKPPMYDFILCDSVMPVMDGPTAAQNIRAMGYDKPIIGVTGNTLPEQIQDFIAHGADEIVTKPVKLAVLKETICRRCNVVNFDGSYYPHGDAGPTKDGGLTPPRVRGMRPSKGGGSSPDSARSSLDNSRTKGLGASPHKGNVETI